MEVTISREEVGLNEGTAGVRDNTYGYGVIVGDYLLASLFTGKPAAVGILDVVIPGMVMIGMMGVMAKVVAGKSSS